MIQEMSRGGQLLKALKVIRQKGAQSLFSFRNCAPSKKGAQSPLCNHKQVYAGVEFIHPPRAHLKYMIPEKRKKIGSECYRKNEVTSESKIC